MRNSLRIVAASAVVGSGIGAGLMLLPLPAFAWHGDLAGSGACSNGQALVEWDLSVSNNQASYVVTGTGGKSASGDTGSGFSANGQFNYGATAGALTVTLTANETWGGDIPPSGPQTFTVTISSPCKIVPPPTSTTQPPPPPTTSTTQPPVVTTLPPPPPTTIPSPPTTQPKPPVVIPTTTVPKPTAVKPVVVQPVVVKAVHVATEAPLTAAVIPVTG